MSTAALLLLVVATTGVSNGTRVVKFAGGATSIHAERSADHVVVRDEKGNVTSDSRCDPGTFDEYLALFTKLREAASRSDQKAIMNLVSYPFRVNAKKPLVFGSAPSLIKTFDDVFTAPVQAKIRKAEPAALFCKDGQATVGDGIIWATRTGLTVLNP